MTRRREEEKRRRNRAQKGAERPSDCVGTCITCIPNCPVHEEERRKRREAEERGKDGEQTADD